MWWRFFTFCVLVSIIILVVVTSIYGRPVIHLFFHRCCGEDIENDQVIFENFGNNFLKERLVGGDIIEADNGTLFQIGDIERIDEMKELLSINDPEVKKWLNDQTINGGIPDSVTESNAEVNQANDGTIKVNETVTSKYEILEETEEATDTDSTKEFMNVHDKKHKRTLDIP